MTSADVLLLVKKIAVGILLTLVPLALIAGGIWIAFNVLR
jgi:hypothetical protein